MFDHLKRLLPSQEAIASSRWLRRFGPALLHRSLWHMSRRGVALGAAIGVFFAFVTPIAQIPLSAALSVLLRANIPVTLAATLVNTPPTFGPVYYAAWGTGSWLLGDDADAANAPQVLRPTHPGAEAASAGPAAAAPHTWRRSWDIVRDIGKPLLLGTLVFAVAFSALAYVLVNLVWHWRVRRKQLRRRRERLARSRAG